MPAVTAERTVQVQGRKIFYREAGDRSAPTILLLHGLPGSSDDYRNLIPALADDFHLIAPDYVGFGQSAIPSPDAFDYTFETVTAHVTGLLEALGIQSYMLYMHDCGGPVGFRLFVQNPDRVTGFIIQNANAYIEGVSNACLKAFAPLWERRSVDTEQAAQAFADAVCADIHPVDAATAEYARSQAHVDHSSVALVDLLEDYKTNVVRYPEWQAAFREHEPLTLIIWGKHDAAFIPPGARAYLKDLPKSKLVWLDAGHSVLDQHWALIASQIKATFSSRAFPTLPSILARQRAALLHRAEPRELTPISTGHQA